MLEVTYLVSVSFLYTRSAVNSPKEIMFTNLK